jgi:glutathionyl-hydroquinone reductase
MDAGIDTGNIVKAAFLPQIKLPAAATNLDENMTYRLLYSFIDPWVRAVVLRDILRLTGYLENIVSTPQAIDAGTTFHFMHTNMSSKVIKKFITERQ